LDIITHSLFRIYEEMAKEERGTNYIIHYIIEIEKPEHLFTFY